MVARSSPGMYCRYSANSTLKPLNGLRCRPDSSPSTIVLAFSSRVPSRATTAGSRKGRSGTLHPALRQRHRFNQAIDDGVGIDTLRLGVEVGDDAVAQDRL